MPEHPDVRATPVEAGSVYRWHCRQRGRNRRQLGIWGRGSVERRELALLRPLRSLTVRSRA